MLIVGLTGGIGAGKTTVSAMLAAKGAHIIDVDALGRLVLEPGERAHAAVLTAFPSTCDPEGRIDRAALAKIVFSDPAELARLEGISHPAINEEIRARLATAHEDIVVLDMAALVGTQLGWLDGRRVYDVVVTVEAPRDVRVARAIARGMQPDDAERRATAQPKDEQRLALADIVVTNDGDTARLGRKVDTLWERLTAPSR